MPARLATPVRPSLQRQRKGCDWSPGDPAAIDTVAIGDTLRCLLRGQGDATAIATARDLARNLCHGRSARLLADIAHADRLPTADCRFPGRRSIPSMLQEQEPGLTAAAGSGVGFPIFSRRTVPGQEFFDAVDLVGGATLEYLGEPGLRIDVAEPCGLDQGVGDDGGPAAAGRCLAGWKDADRRDNLLRKLETEGSA